MLDFVNIIFCNSTLILLQSGSIPQNGDNCIVPHYVNTIEIKPFHIH